MSRFICNACGGEYDTRMVDRTAYYHACPESVAVLDRRDENVKSTDSRDAGSMKALGKGVTPK